MTRGSRQVPVRQSRRRGEVGCRSELRYNIRMNKRLKLIKIGNSTGVILPKEVLARLRVALGDEVFLSESQTGFTLSAHNAEFAEAMTAAEEIMREDRDILAVLAR